MDTYNTEIFLCQCGDVSHQCVIGYWTEAPDHDVYLSVHLVKSAGFFKRIWFALRYIFGKPSVYGDFDEIILRPADAPKLQKVVDYLKQSEAKD